MCFHTRQTKTAIELKNRFKASFPQEDYYTPKPNFNGFEHPKTPVICNQDSNEIKLFQWGLIPSWAKDNRIQNSTLNAKIETIAQKVSFKASLNQRCLILCDGFYEWKWLDSKGKKKEKFLIGLENQESFCMAGLWSTWVNPINQDIIFTYTILTTKADLLMSEIHNSTKRMPIVLSERSERAWMMGNMDLEINNRLIAKSLEPRNDLFS